MVLAASLMFTCFYTRIYPNVQSQKCSEPDIMTMSGLSGGLPVSNVKQDRDSSHPTLYISVMFQLCSCVSWHVITYRFWWLNLYREGLVWCNLRGAVKRNLGLLSRQDCLYQNIYILSVELHADLQSRQKVHCDRCSFSSTVLRTRAKSSAAGDSVAKVQRSQCYSYICASHRWYRWCL